MPTYIALTALESHWGAPKNTLLLTDGCRLYDGGNEWEKYPEPVDMERFHTIAAFDAAYEYCSVLSSQVFPLLAERLEQRFRVGCSLRFYERIVYPWLFQFTQALYDRFTSIQRAANAGSDVRFLTAPVASLPYPDKDCQSWTEKIQHDDAINLHLYSDIIRFLDLPRQDRPSKPLVADLPVWEGTNARTLRRMAEYALRAYSRVIHRPPHLLYDMLYYGMYGSFRQIPRHRSFRLIPASMSKVQLPAVMLDAEFRTASLQASRPAEIEFEKMLHAFIPRYIPFGMCECLPGLVRWAASQTVPRKSVFVTSIGFLTNLPLMVLVGVTKRPLAIIEHGGGVLLRHFFSTDVQPIVADRYFPLGGDTVPSAMLSASSPSLRISAPLLAANDGTRFLPRLTRVVYEGSAQNYHLRRLAFLRLIPPHNFPSIRLYYREYGWGVRKRLETEFPTLTYQVMKQTPLEQAMADACLLVLDHYGTTFHRAMAINHPTLLFSPPGIYSDDAENILKVLRSSGIWHDSPEKAAAFYNSLVPDGIQSWAEAAPTIHEWWYGTEVQRARCLFCDQYARTSLDWTREWTREFDILAYEGPRTKAVCEMRYDHRETRSNCQ